MDKYSHIFPPAPDSDAGVPSVAVKGGVPGGFILLLLVVIIYVIMRNGGCFMNCKVRAGDGDVPRRAEEEA
jgi:hypothetical protein